MRNQIEMAIRAVQAAKKEITEIKKKAAPDFPKFGKIEDAELVADLLVKRLEELKNDVPKSST